MSHTGNVVDRRDMGSRISLALLAGDTEGALALLGRLEDDPADVGLKELHGLLAACSDRWSESLESWDWQLTLRRLANQR